MNHETDQKNSLQTRQITLTKNWLICRVEVKKNNQCFQYRLGKVVMMSSHIGVPKLVGDPPDHVDENLVILW